MGQIRESLYALLGEVETAGEGTVSPPTVCRCGTNMVWSDAPPATQVLYCPVCGAKG